MDNQTNYAIFIGKIPYIDACPLKILYFLPENKRFTPFLYQILLHIMKNKVHPVLSGWDRSSDALVGKICWTCREGGNSQCQKFEG